MVSFQLAETTRKPRSGTRRKRAAAKTTTDTKPQDTEASDPAQPARVVSELPRADFDVEDF